MAGVRTPTAAQVAVGTIAFELERFEPTGERQVEVAGRWFGVRGRRFVRPTLTLNGGAMPRVLADLDHKPWAAEEGEPWIATFRMAVPHDEVEQAELSVAPDIAIELPAPSLPARGRTRSRAKPRLIERSTPTETQVRARNRTATSTGGAGQREDPRELLEDARAQISSLQATRDAAYERLASERDALAKSQAELKEALAAQARAADSSADATEVEPLRTELATAVAERDRMVDELRRTRRERDEAVASRDAAESERDALAAERLAAQRRRDELASDRQSLQAERAALDGERAALVSERVALERRRAELEERRREAVHARDVVARECEALAAKRDALGRDVAALEEHRENLAAGPAPTLRALSLAGQSPEPHPMPGLDTASPPARAPDLDFGRSRAERPLLSSARLVVLAGLAALAIALILVVRLSV